MANKLVSKTEESSHGRQKNRLAAKTVGLLTLIFLFSCVARFGFGPLMPAIEEDLNIDHAAAGMIFFWLSLGYCVGILTSGRISSSINHRRTVIFSALATVCVLLVAACSVGAWSLSITLMMVALACGWYLPSGLATITHTVAQTNWGKAFAFHEVAPNISLIFTPFLIEFCLLWSSWRWVSVIFAFAVLAGGLCFYYSGLGSREKSEPVASATIREAFSSASVWSMILLFGLAICSNIGIYMMLPLYLVSEVQFDREWANTIVGLSRITGLLTIMGAGYIADMMKPQLAMGIILGLGGVCVALIGCVDGSWLLIALLLQSVFAACFFPAGFIALMRVHPLAVTLCPPIGFLIGGGGIPAVIGIMAEAGYFPEAMVLSGLLMCVGAVILPPLVRLEQKDGKNSTGE